MAYVDATRRTVENENFRLFELRPVQLGIQVPKRAISNIVVSNSLVFTGGVNCLKILAVHAILDFEWNPRIGNHPLTEFPSITIPLGYEPYFMSCCAGSNSVLVVCGAHSASGQTQLDLFDISNPELINANLKPFATLPLNAKLTESQLCTLDWHPEFNESLFVAVFTDGTLLTVGVNRPAQSAKILSKLAYKEKITCAAWSPKGKQFAIGKSNGQIVQIKHNNGQDFQEAKIIQPPAELQGYEVNSLRWCFSTLFSATYVNLGDSQGNPDTKFVSIYAVPKTQVVFNDHGGVLIDLYTCESDQRYQAQCNHLENLLICSTTCSSEVSVLGCLNPKEQLGQWALWNSDQSVSLTLPSSNNETTPRGIVLYAQETKQFKVMQRINGAEQVVTYGGKNCPLMLVMTSAGLLFNYYIVQPGMVLSDPISSKQLEFSATTQPNPQRTPQQIQSIQQQMQLMQQQQAQKTKKTQEFQQSSLSQVAQAQPHQTKTVEMPAHSQVQAAQQPATSHSSANLHQEPQQIFPAEIAQSKQHQANIAQPTDQQQQLQQATSQPQISAQEKQKQAEKDEQNAYLVAISDEIQTFRQQLQLLREQSKKVHEMSVGSSDDKILLTKFANDWKSILNQSQTLLDSCDVEMLQTMLLENFALYDDVKSRLDRSDDAKFNFLMKRRSLDPITSRKLKEILQKQVYIETNLKELIAILDNEWKDYLSMEKGKLNNQTEQPLQLVSRTVASHKQTIRSLEKQLKQLETRMLSASKTDADERFSNRLRQMQKVTELMNSCRVRDLASLVKSASDNQRLIDTSPNRRIQIQSLSRNERDGLRKFLEQIQTAPIIRSTLLTDVNSSMLISAVTKAKQKLSATQKASTASSKQRPNAAKAANCMGASKPVSQQPELTEIKAPCVPKAKSVAKPAEQLSQPPAEITSQAAQSYLQQQQAQQAQSLTSSQQQMQLQLQRQMFQAQLLALAQQQFGPQLTQLIAGNPGAFNPGTFAPSTSNPGTVSNALNLAKATIATPAKPIMQTQQQGTGKSEQAFNPVIEEISPPSSPIKLTTTSNNKSMSLKPSASLIAHSTPARPVAQAVSKPSAQNSGFAFNQAINLANVQTPQASPIKPPASSVSTPAASSSMFQLSSKPAMTAASAATVQTTGATTLAASTEPIEVATTSAVSASTTASVASFDFSLGCLGAKPNPENLKKNPFAPKALNFTTASSTATKTDLAASSTSSTAPTPAGGSLFGISNLLLNKESKPILDKVANAENIPPSTSQPALSSSFIATTGLFGAQETTATSILTTTALTLSGSVSATTAPTTYTQATSISTPQTTTLFGKPAFSTTAVATTVPALASSSAPASSTTTTTSASTLASSATTTSAITTTTSIFGSGNATSTSPFAKPASGGLFSQAMPPASSTAAASGSIFGAGANSIFASSSSASKSSPFGGTPAASQSAGVTTAASSPFAAATAALTTTSAFGSSSIFGQSTAVSQPSSSLFGGFGHQQQQQQAATSSAQPQSSLFGTPKPTFGSAFGSPGASAFGASPTFGGAPSFGSPPAFGAPPSFGGKAGFGSPSAFGSTFGSSNFGNPPVTGATSGSVFGSNTSSAGFGGFANASNVPTFGSLASSSDAPTFGALAGNQQPGFGSFGGSQQQQQQQQQPTGAFSGGAGASSTSSFTGSSFSQRRA